MATPAVIDVETLLHPIPGANPSGADVKGSRHPAIVEARRQDEDLPMGDWQPKGPPKMADWNQVKELAMEVLETESKDLKVAVWLVEALVKLHGFAGLRDGLKLLRELHAHFWDSMYPIIERDDPEDRAGPLQWLNINDKTPLFPLTIQQVPLFISSDREPYSYYHLLQAQELQNYLTGHPKLKKNEIEEAVKGKVTIEQFETAQAGTPLPHCLAIFEDLKTSEEELHALDGVLKEKYGEGHPERPGLGNIQKVLESCREYLAEVVKKKGGITGKAEPKSASPGMSIRQGSEGGRVMTAANPGSIDPVDRPDALRRLQAIAEFFRRTEPHSPIPFLVQRATRWGEMPLEEWLNEVIKSKDVLGNVRETLGLKDDKAKS